MGTTSEWQNRTLGDLADVVKGVTYRGIDIGEGEDGLVSITAIKPGGGFISGGVRTFGGPRKPQHELSPGEIVVALTDLTQTGALIGSPAVVPRTEHRCLVAAHHVAAVRAKDGADRSFLYFRLTASDFQRHAATYSTGTTVRQVKPRDLATFPIRLPPLDEQRRIVGVLGALDDKVEAEHRKRGGLDRLIRLAGGRLVRDGAEHWSLGRLGDHYGASRGLSYSGDGLTDELAPGMPLHNLNSVREGGGYKFDGIKRYVGAFKDRHRVRPGDLVVANTEQGFDELLIAYPAIVPSLFGGEGLYSHHLHRVVPIDRTHMSRHWLFVWLLDKRNHDLIAGYANGTTVNMLPVDALQDPVLPIPPVERVRALDEVVAPLVDAIEASYRETSTLAAIRDTLLPKLVSGTIRVPDSYDPDDALGTVLEAADVAVS